MVLSKKEIGLLIKKARKNKSEIIGKKYTQNMLAKDLGISRGYIGDIENGRIYPNFVLLNKIAEACEVPFIFFSNNEDLLQQVIKKEYPSMNEDERKALSNIINRYNNSLPSDMKSLDWDLNIYKSIYDDYKNIPDDVLEVMNDNNEPLGNENQHINQSENNDNKFSSISYEILDVKTAMDLILSQPGLMLNGELLSDESKIALANAIQMGLAYAEQMQNKEKK